MEKSDFIRTENYNLRLRPTGARKVTEEVNRWMNKTIEYQGKEYTWAYVLLLKTRELAHYLVGKKGKLDLVSPGYEVDRQDSDEIRRKILSISYTDWKNLGFSKGTLHYLKKNARDERPFTINSHVRERLEMWSIPHNCPS
jgi:CRISP-associated protein Cas1